jgi:hypothetical protein
MTQKYALLHEDGTVRGFLSDDVHDEIPAEAVPISDAIWSEWIDNTATRRWIDGALVVVELAPPAPVPQMITPREFRLRFTLAERAALTLAASQALLQGDPSLQVFLDDLSAAQAVDLTHPEILAGMEAIVAAALISRARADEILAP